MTQTNTTQIDLDKLREEFIAWLRTKDADEEYPYFNCERCPACQYAASVGEYTGEVATFFRQDNSIWYAVHDMTEYHNELGTRPWTFGALLIRMEALDATPTT